MNKKLFRNQYRINSPRLKHWDYSNDGCYFVTICTKGFIEYFGKVKNNEIKLSKIGKIAEKYWQKYQNIFRILNWINILLCQIMCMG